MFRVSFVVFRVSFVVFRVSFVVFRVSFVAFYRVSFVATPCFNRGQAVVKGLIQHQIVDSKSIVVVFRHICDQDHGFLIHTNEVFILNHFS